MDNLKVGDCVKCICSVGCNFRGIIFKITDDCYCLRKRKNDVQEFLLKKLCHLIIDVEEIHKMKLYFYGNL